MHQRPTRLQRSELAVPATSPKFFLKAAASQADSLFLDLEDAVAPAQKDQARAQAIDALNQVDWGSKTVAVRVCSSALGETRTTRPVQRGLAVSFSASSTSGSWRSSTFGSSFA